MALKTYCPECTHRLKLGSGLHVGQRKVCPKCGTQLEVVGLRPLVLDVYDIFAPRPGTGVKKRTAAEALCPECERSLRLGAHPRTGQRVICPECQSALEVVSLNPLELDVPIGIGGRNRQQE